MVYINRQPRQLCLGLNADVTATVREVKKCLAMEAKVAMDQVSPCGALVARLIEDFGF